MSREREWQRGRRRAEDEDDTLADVWQALAADPRASAMAAPWDPAAKRGAAVAEVA